MVDDPAAFAQASVAAKGLFALDYLLFDPDAPTIEAQSYRCRLLGAIADDLASVAAAALARWRDPYAGYLTSAGAPENPLFLQEYEGARALYTALTAAIATDADVRLGRPLGAADRPHPKRAEAWRSGRSLRNVILSIEALEDYQSTVFGPDLAPPVRARLAAAFTAARAAAERVPEPLDEAVATADGRFRIEVLQMALRRLLQMIETTIGEELGVTRGFNAMDGD